MWCSLKHSLIFLRFLSSFPCIVRLVCGRTIVWCSLTCNKLFANFQMCCQDLSSSSKWEYMFITVSIFCFLNNSLPDSEYPKPHRTLTVSHRLVFLFLSCIQLFLSLLFGPEKILVSFWTLLFAVVVFFFVFWVCLVVIYFFVFWRSRCFCIV